jgi:hypothetical protein
MASDVLKLRLLAQRAYDALSKVFDDHKDDILEIEILPSAMAPQEGQSYIQDGLNVGIPKKALVSAFLRAREVFAGRDHTSQEVPDMSQEALSATCIILLFDPEYLTAANYRKAHYLSHPPEELPKAHTRELNFLNSILLSPLHRQSKSPTLWQHRYWLVSHSFSPPAINGLVEDAGQAERSLQGIFDEELNAVFKAGERHANNYYAWGYGRSLVRFMQSLEERTDGKVGWPTRNEATTRVLRWCKSHPSDTSGWSFLLFLLLRDNCGEGQAYGILEEVLEFIVAVKWEKEALWHFIRTGIAGCKFKNDEERDRLILEVGRTVGVLQPMRQVTVQAGGEMSGKHQSFPSKVFDQLSQDTKAEETGVKTVQHYGEADTEQTTGG